MQHAHNPVDWYPWGEEAFERAVREDKPVLVSIGYSACHWCHVMERESFENEEVAAVMNEHFINIKVDREERPDVDHVYMDAVQALSESGGWPLNVFLTPDRRPFYGGTYFPPRRAFNRPSWTEVLLSMSQAYRERRGEVEQQAQSLTDHLQASNGFGLSAATADLFEDGKIDTAFAAIMKNADREWGGFGHAPKFPQSFTIQFLLQYAHTRKNEEAKTQALLSLDKMLQGGLYDQLGGGFARYSTDAEWLAPHFEKMLYDNALLVGNLADAFLLTGNKTYRVAIEETLAFIERELLHPEGGFYSALDADSEGEEGRFYVWDRSEVDELLGERASLFCNYYDITEKGNWEGKNILRIRQPLAEYAAQQKVNDEAMEEILKEGRAVLMERRNMRVRPQLDDKVLLGWNALMNTACSKAFAATGNERYKELAMRNMEFLLAAFRGEMLWHHTWKNGRATQPAFLDDYSCLIAALIELAQVTADFKYFEEAAVLAELVVEHFGDEETPFFYFTHKGQDDILVRKKELYDGATPSGNSVMAYNLYRLSVVYGRQEWRQRAEGMVRSMGGVPVKYPTSFGVWLALLFELTEGTAEIAVVGKDWKNYLEKLLGIYISHKLALAAPNPLPGYPLLADKASDSKILIYVCKNYACRQPVSTMQDLISLLESK